MSERVSEGFLEADAGRMRRLPESGEKEACLTKGVGWGSAGGRE